MSSRFLLLCGLVVGMVALVLAAFFLRGSEYGESRREHFQLVLNDQNNKPPFYPIYTQTSVTQLRGHTTGPASIECSRGKTVLLKTETDSAGNFTVSALPLIQGVNNIECSATNSSRDSFTDSITIVWEPLQPPAPTLDQLSATINTPEVYIKGSTFPTAVVRIHVQPVMGKQHTQGPGLGSFTTDLHAGADGRFETAVPLAVAAKYEITAVSRNSLGKESKASDKIQTTYDPYWYPTSPTAITEPSTAPTRKATVTISHKQLSINCEVVMARDDPAAQAFLTNKAQRSEFLDDIFELHINGTHYRSIFRDVDPRVTLSEQLVTISASSESSFRDLMPIFSGSLTLSLHPLISSRDSLTIITNDYVVKNITPAPTKLENNTATWIGANGPPRSKERAIAEAVTLELDYSPLSSPSRTIRFLRMNPYSLWTYPGNIVPTLLYGILNAIPIFWMLLFLKGIGQVSFAEQIQVLVRQLQALAVLGLVDTVWDVIYGLSYLLYHFRIFHAANSAAPELHLLASLLIFGLFSLVQLIVRSKTKRGQWVRAICRAIRYAALINLGLIAGFKLLEGRPRLVVAGQILIGFVVLLLILNYIRLLINTLAITLSRPKWWGGFALLLIAAFSIPFGSLPDDYFPSIDVLFYAVRDLAPIIAALVLVVFLKKLSDAGQEEASAWTVQAALIVFCAYLVGATTTLFMVPIPFILSFLAFRLFVVNDVDPSQKLASVAPSVFQNRRALIEKVIANDMAQDIKSNLDKLGEKVSSGELKIEDFKKHIQQVEAYATERDQAATLNGNISAEEAVLGIGVSPHMWQNAMWTVKFGALLSLPFLVIYLAELLVRGSFLFGESYRLLLSLTKILTFGADWLIGAFFFGYFFKSIKGNSGLKKGLRVGCAVIACLLPVWCIATSSRVELLAIVLRAGQTFLFFTFLGLGSDYKIFRETMTNRFTWKLFTRFGDMPSFTAVASVIITTLGVALTTVLTGQFTELVAQLVGTALNQPAPRP